MLLMLGNGAALAIVVAGACARAALDPDRCAAQDDPAGVDRIDAARPRAPARALPPILWRWRSAGSPTTSGTSSARTIPDKAERLMAARLAYDHALRDYCRAVDIPVPTAIRGLSTRAALPHGVRADRHRTRVVSGGRGAPTCQIPCADRAPGW